MFNNWLNRLISTNDILRPPGALDESEFLQKCIRCRKCAEVCPYFSIKMAHGESGFKMGTPYIESREMPCYLCEDFPCVDACPSEALSHVESKKDVKMGIAIIDESICFAYNGIICRACYERCPIYGVAITLKDELFPIVHKEHCVGCGICVNVCFTEQVSIKIDSRYKLNA